MMIPNQQIQQQQASLPAFSWLNHPAFNNQMGQFGGPFGFSPPPLQMMPGGGQRPTDPRVRFLGPPEMQPFSWMQPPIQRGVAPQFSLPSANAQAMWQHRFGMPYQLPPWLR